MLWKGQGFMRAFIAMSGGVDSSAAAQIMKARGYECVGCTMKLFAPSDLKPVETGLASEAGTAEGKNDEDALFIMGRQTLNFIDLSSESLFSFQSLPVLIKSLFHLSQGLNLTETVFIG